MTHMIHMHHKSLVSLPKDIVDLMRANGLRTARGEDIDPIPLVKLFTPDAHAIWLLTELDPDNDSIAFGLCDLGLGFPELGHVSLAELAALRGPLGLAVERDVHYRETRPLSALARLARRTGRIISSPVSHRMDPSLPRSLR